MSEAQPLVVILYENPLLGEGIAKYLRAELGVEVMLAAGNDLEAVRSALALGPAVVIFELSDNLRHVDLAALAPYADLIDVSTVVARGPVVPSEVADLEQILQAIRRRLAVDEPAEASTGQTPAWRPIVQVKQGMNAALEPNVSRIGRSRYGTTKATYGTTNTFLPGLNGLTRARRPFRLRPSEDLSVGALLEGGRVGQRSC